MGHRLPGEGHYLSFPSTFLKVSLFNMPACEHAACKIVQGLNVFVLSQPFSADLHVQVNCHNASANTFVALMGDSQADFRYYGPPELYERYVGKAPTCSKYCSCAQRRQRTSTVPFSMPILRGRIRGLSWCDVV